MKTKHEFLKDWELRDFTRPKWEFHQLLTSESASDIDFYKKLKNCF